MTDDTIEVDREKLEEIQRLAEYSYGKLQKTTDWRGPTQKVGHISEQTAILLGDKEGELEEFEYD
jgi:hypothetical protein